MAREQTVVALGDDARKAVAAAMRRRGETAATYFSNPEGGTSVPETGFPVSRLSTPMIRVGGAASGVGYVRPDKLEQYRRGLVKAALNSGAQDAELTTALFKSPEDSYASRKAEAIASVEAENAAWRAGVQRKIESVGNHYDDDLAGLPEAPVKNDPTVLLLKRHEKARKGAEYISDLYFRASLREQMGSVLNASYGVPLSREDFGPGQLDAVRTLGGKLPSGTGRIGPLSSADVSSLNALPEGVLPRTSGQLEGINEILRKEHRGLFSPPEIRGMFAKQSRRLSGTNAIER